MKRLLLLLAAGLALVGCLANGNVYESSLSPPGFWLGLWHGIVAPLSFVISLFTDKVGMYEVANNGAWYDLGFLIGLGVLHGGGAAGRKVRRGRRRTD
jgi:hypothetical protein